MSTEQDLITPETLEAAFEMMGLHIFEEDLYLAHPQRPSTLLHINYAEEEDTWHSTLVNSKSLLSKGPPTEYDNWDEAFERAIDEGFTIPHRPIR